MTNRPSLQCSQAISDSFEVTPEHHVTQQVPKESNQVSAGLASVKKERTKKRLLVSQPLGMRSWMSLIDTPMSESYNCTSPLTAEWSDCGSARTAKVLELGNYGDILPMRSYPRPTATIQFLEKHLIRWDLTSWALAIDLYRLG